VERGPRAASVVRRGHGEAPEVRQKERMEERPRRRRRQRSRRRLSSPLPWEVVERPRSGVGDSLVVVFAEIGGGDAESLAIVVVAGVREEATRKVGDGTG
jgi:hypothetical protein